MFYPEQEANVLSSQVANPSSDAPLQFVCAVLRREPTRLATPLDERG